MKLAIATIILLVPLLFGAGDPHEKPASAVDTEHKQQCAMLLKRVDSLIAEEKEAAAVIDWNNPNRDTSVAEFLQKDLAAAFESASKELGELGGLAGIGEGSGVDQDTVMHVSERAVQLRPTAQSLLMLGKSLDYKYGRYVYTKSEAEYKYTTQEILKSFLTCFVSEVLREDPTPGKDCVSWSAPHSRVPLKIEPVDGKLTLLIPDWDEEIEMEIKFCSLTGRAQLHAHEWDLISPTTGERVAQRRA